LLSVELDRRAGDDAPRVTVKRVQPLSDLAKRTRLQTTVRVQDGATAARIARDLATVRESNGTLRFIVPLASGGEAVIVACRDYALDAEIAARIERISGEGSVDLSVQEPPKLALVG
jgi:DNA polymerase-3 subunit alpha